MGQSEADLQNFSRYVGRSRRWDLAATGFVALTAPSAGAFPIGIDVDEFTAPSQAPPAQDMFERMTRGIFPPPAAAGVERLDYSKVCRSVRVFPLAAAATPENIKSAIDPDASPSREDGMGTYTDPFR
jgi:trehalose 6-phosphate synthase